MQFQVVREVKEEQGGKKWQIQFKNHSVLVSGFFLFWKWKTGQGWYFLETTTHGRKLPGFLLLAFFRLKDQQNQSWRQVCILFPYKPGFPLHAYRKRRLEIYCRTFRAPLGGEPLQLKSRASREIKGGAGRGESCPYTCFHPPYPTVCTSSPR